MAFIALQDGKEAVIDATDVPVAEGQPWRFTSGGYVGYVRPTPRKDGKRKSRWVFLHRLIAGTPAGMATDHADGDTLNNRRSNLRVVTNSQNSRNQRTRTRVKTSRFKGVHWYAPNGKWAAKVTTNYKAEHLGYFANEEDAARAYDEAATRAHGEYAALNFPP